MKRLLLITLALASFSFSCNPNLNLCRMARMIEDARDPVMRDIERGVTLLVEWGHEEKALKVVEEAPNILNGIQNIKFILVNANNGVADQSLAGTIRDLRVSIEDINALYSLIKDGRPLFKEAEDVQKLLMLAELLAGETKIPHAGSSCPGEYKRTNYDAWSQKLKGLVVK